MFLAGELEQCHSHPQQQQPCPPGEDSGVAGRQGGVAGRCSGGEEAADGADGYYPCCKATVYRC